MKKQKFPKQTGIALAIAAAGVMAGVTISQPAVSAPTGTSDLVHCYGVNACGGHNDCKGADNACAGKASCKGTGFVAMPAKACGDVGGKQQDEWVGQVSSADFIHCFGVNVCKGHNDCKGPCFREPKVCPVPRLESSIKFGWPAGVKNDKKA